MCKPKGKEASPVQGALDMNGAVYGFRIGLDQIIIAARFQSLDPIIHRSFGT